MPTTHPLHAGFTLLEVLVSLFLIILALGALEGASAVTLRRMRESDREATATRLVQRRMERLLSEPCVPSSGADSSNGLTATWSATPDDGVLWVDQEVRYRTTSGPHVERSRSAGACR